MAEETMSYGPATTGRSLRKALCSWGASHDTFIEFGGNSYGDRVKIRSGACVPAEGARAMAGKRRQPSSVSTPLAIRYPRARSVRGYRPTRAQNFGEWLGTS